MSSSLNRKTRRKQMVTQKQYNKELLRQRYEIMQEVREDVVKELNPDFEEEIFLSMAYALNKLYGFSGKRISDVWYATDEIRAEVRQDMDKYRKYLAEKCKVAWGGCVDD